MPRTRTVTAAVLCAPVGAALALFAATAPSRSGADDAAAPTVRRYGGGATVGRGRARSYVLVDRRTGAPTEIGVALDEHALDGLPADGAGHHGQSGPVHQYVLPLPSGGAAPFRFVELNWNPGGHEPDGVYAGVPHFDFHFYTVDKAARDSIVPSNPAYRRLADALPAPEYVPAFNAQLGPRGAGRRTWRCRSWACTGSTRGRPSCSGLLGRPDAYRPFTATFLHGSWGGRVHFWEPMITRAHLLAKRTAADPAVRDEVIPLPLPRRYQAPGHYPTAYRITWDAKAGEYRVALTGLVRRG
jgi:hypothetical protein